MKLKKFASLALAGVMAVSMLAGCAGKGADSKPTEEPAANLATTLISDLSEETTKTFTVTESASLKATLEKALKVTGESVNNGTVKTNMLKFDDTLAGLGFSIVTDPGNEATDKEVGKYLDVFSMSTNSQFTEDYVLGKLAAQIDAAKVYNGTTAMSSKLPAYSDDYKEADGKTEYYYNFDYAAQVAVVAVPSTVSDNVTYVVALYATRTPVKTATPVKG